MGNYKLKIKMQYINDSYNKILKIPIYKKNEKLLFKI